MIHKPQRITADLLLRVWFLSPTREAALQKTRMLQPARKVLRRLVQDLIGAEKRESAAMIVGYCLDELGFDPRDSSPSEGRPPPRVGDVRNYQVQTTKAGKPFVKIMIHCFHVAPGKRVRVEYRDTEMITISPER